MLPIALISVARQFHVDTVTVQSDMRHTLAVWMTMMMVMTKHMKKSTATMMMMTDLHEPDKKSVNIAD